MKKCLVILIALLPLTAAAQQHTLEELAAHLGTDRISLQYAFTIAQPAPVKLSGVLLIQGDCYQAKGNGVEIYCDGTTRWTVDPASREVYIETAGDIEEFALWQDDLEDLSLTQVRYLPVSDDLSPFFFDTAALDADWVVTDLR
ncbi:MAG: hypothetical protein GXY24_06865 [Bacteroidales bacterium]|jgi:hypothetical protein|nr:hypothetical protein [Bacteroidales bacterium]